MRLLAWWWWRGCGWGGGGWAKWKGRGASVCAPIARSVVVGERCDQRRPKRGTPRQPASPPPLHCSACMPHGGGGGPLVQRSALVPCEFLAWPGLGQAARRGRKKTQRKKNFIHIMIHPNPHPHRTHPPTHSTTTTTERMLPTALRRLGRSAGQRVVAKVCSRSREMEWTWIA